MSIQIDTLDGDLSEASGASDLSSLSDAMHAMTMLVDTTLSPEEAMPHWHLELSESLLGMATRKIGEIDGQHTRASDTVCGGIIALAKHRSLKLSGPCFVMLLNAKKLADQIIARSPARTRPGPVVLR